MKPGEEFIQQGLEDLAAGRESIPALLVCDSRLARLAIILSGRQA